MASGQPERETRSGKEWADFLDQELARRDTRQYFLWTVALALFGFTTWLLLHVEPHPCDSRQVLSATCIGALLYWIVLKRLRQRFTSSTSPTFVHRNITPTQFLVPIRYYRAIGVPTSVRVRSIFEALVALAIMPA